MIKHRNIVYLFVSPVIAVLLCISSTLVLTDEGAYSMKQPDFLSYVDQLSLFTVGKEIEPEFLHIRDVFVKTTPSARNITVSLIVESPAGSFCIINGQRLSLGESGDGFILTSFDRDSVSLSFPDGTKETFYVTAY
ncbi:MAG TPA: hypothetical protein ENN34_03330 [Deltaproteobacteria bacterium]|nr:hypothetical protein [Deltaproteobacteria bacterium]